jgi:hypothetical protein
MPERRFPPPWSVEETDPKLSVIRLRVQRPGGDSCCGGVGVLAGAGVLGATGTSFQGFNTL